MRHTADSQARYLTTAEAALYCRFKSTAAIRKARLEGRLHPVGRRGGTGTWMWSVDELDRFLQGQPTAMVEPDRSGAPPSHGDANERKEQQLDNEVEEPREANSASRGVSTEGRRNTDSSEDHRPNNGTTNRDQASAPRGKRGAGVSTLGRGEKSHQTRQGSSRASEDALLRLRRLSLGTEDRHQGDQKRQGS
ncbi:MAG: helix-turn-helix domain-containing protein [Polyangiaceae bacterium]|nr:helix-turn-helix domain-containing protein [Polyangiaceae bacterium]